VDNCPTFHTRLLACIEAVDADAPADQFLAAGLATAAKTEPPPVEQAASTEQKAAQEQGEEEAPETDQVLEFAAAGSINGQAEDVE
jgi:hypothetical protein